MSNQTEIIRSLADLVKAMAILKENQEAIEQKLITPSFEKGGHINNKDGEFITGPIDLTNFNEPSKTAIPVTIEDLKSIQKWIYGERRESISITPYEFFKKYLP